ncbi:MAG: Asp23/Gls24 family envelope stress response protein, partial [Chloroflexi bacterium]|nr:Asp23/Gls24 family envelope stress response protein [Chloroflexota bacterium]
MSKETRSPGRTTVAPDVILSIARLTAISVEGVSQMSGYTHINELFQKGH